MSYSDIDEAPRPHHEDYGYQSYGYDSSAHQDDYRHRALDEAYRRERDYEARTGSSAQPQRRSQSPPLSRPSTAHQSDGKTAPQEGQADWQRNDDGDQRGLKRKMKELRGAYLGSGGGAASSRDSGPTGAATTATASWKKHLSVKKKRSTAADDGFMVSIPTAHLHQQSSSTSAAQPAGEKKKAAPSASGSAKIVTSASLPALSERSRSSRTDEQDASSAAVDPNTHRYVDKAAQRRQHLRSIERTLPRGVSVHDLANSTGGRVGGAEARIAAATAAGAITASQSASAWSSSGDREEEQRESRRTAATPIAESNRGFKLLSAMAGAGSSGEPSVNPGVAGEERAAQDTSRFDQPWHQDGGEAGSGRSGIGSSSGHFSSHEPILARGTAGRAGLGSGSLRDIDQIAAQSSSARAGAGAGSYSEYGREAAMRRWQETGQSEQE
ncbi:hypothetical protein OC834_005523 [Tilletia horrida]|nr:hypothetical protein OC834_005523 [Tilletia horrida]KAK0543369.1 hypothetical protein OC844_007617 [Tilletia horrida]